MRIESSGDPYKNLSDALYSIIIDKEDLCIETYILHIRTGVLGDDHVICKPCFDTGDVTWYFDTDWYEGGEIDFLGYCALSDLEIPDNVDAEPAQVTDEEVVKPRWNYSYVAMVDIGGVNKMLKPLENGNVPIREVKKDDQGSVR